MERVNGKPADEFLFCYWCDTHFPMQSFLWTEKNQHVKIFPWTGKNEYMILADTDFIAMGGGYVYYMLICCTMEKYSSRNVF